MKNKIQLFTQKALFAKGGEVLILNSARDEYWELPGGKLEVGEEPETGLSREVKEELDIDDFEVQKILHVFSFEATDEDADWYFVVCVYLCKLGDKNIRLSEEHSDAKWVRTKEIRNYLMRSGYYDAIEKCLTSKR